MGPSGDEESIHIVLMHETNSIICIQLYEQCPTDCNLAFKFLKWGYSNVSNSTVT